jgi:CheY-like chemotaxis protein
VDVNRLVSELVPMLRRLLGEDRELVLELDQARPCGVLSDPGQLEQVIVNLALNARDAMAGGGRLTIGARPLEVGPGLAARAEVDPGRFIEVRVEDTGAGMSPEVLDRIFEPFYSTKASEGRGSGLGLATVYGYLEQCRGGILVESEVGSGSTFRLLLPEQELVAVREDEAVIETTEEGEAGPATVLLVEDEAAIRLMVETALSRVGHRVVVAESPEDALELAEQQGDAVDLLLTDVVMPGMGGPELAATLREQRPGLRVLYMSGFNDDQLLRRGLERGEAQFLAKPFSIQTLLEQVRGALVRPPSSGS